MHISKTKWLQIRAEVNRGIRRLNQVADERGREDQFTVTCKDIEGVNVIVTQHWTGNRWVSPKVITREITTGEMRKATARIGAGLRLEALKVKESDPLFWKALMKKPVAEVVRKLKLVAFTVTDPVGETANAVEQV